MHLGGVFVFYRTCTQEGRKEFEVLRSRICETVSYSLFCFPDMQFCRHRMCAEYLSYRRRFVPRVKTFMVAEHWPTSAAYTSGFPVGFLFRGQRAESSALIFGVVCCLR